MLNLSPQDGPAWTVRTVRINLVIVLTFALLALIVLTRTAVSAARIDHDVAAAVDPNLQAVRDETLHLPALDRMAELVRAIAAATVPLDLSVGNAARLNGEAATTLHEIRDNLGGTGRTASASD